MLDIIFSPLVASVLAGLACIALALAFRPSHASQAMEGRLSVFLSREEMRAVADGMDGLRGSFLERVVIPTLRKSLAALGRLAPAQTLESINEQLTLAGRPGNLTAADFAGISLIFILAGAGLGLFAGRVVGAKDPRLGFLAIGGCLAVGYLLPKQWLGGKVRTRKEAMQCALPDALDMLTICVEAGLAFESALQRVADQWQGPLSDEFSRVVSEIRLGVLRTQALRRMAQRCNTPDLASFVAVLVQADSMGTSVAQVLRSQSDQIRTLRRQRAEEKANKAPIKVLVVMVLFIFPALFVVILGPAVPKILEAF